MPLQKSCGVLVLEQGSRIIAREIYGPVIQVWGRIEKVSEGHIVVEEQKYTQSPDTLKKPTGITLNMLYDSRTSFRPECTSDSLKPGVIIQSTAVGRVPGRLIADTGNLCIQGAYTFGR
jgi:hypothetical protein